MMDKQTLPKHTFNRLFLSPRDEKARRQIYILIHLPLYFAPQVCTCCQPTVAATCATQCMYVPAPGAAYTIQVITMVLERQSECPSEKYILPYLFVLAWLQQVSAS